MADFYCALPVVSSSLTGALFGSPLFRRTLGINVFGKASYDLIFAARKLRHPVLFRECFSHIVGTWSDGFLDGRSSRLHHLDVEMGSRGGKYIHAPGYDALKADAQLNSLVCTAHMDLCRLLLHNSHNLIVHCFDIPNSLSDDPPLMQAKYYRSVRSFLLEANAGSPGGLDGLTWNKLDGLLKSEIRFQEAYWFDYFLCATISDEDLPVSYAIFVSYACSVLLQDVFQLDLASASLGIPPKTYLKYY